MMIEKNKIKLSNKTTKQKIKSLIEDGLIPIDFFNDKNQDEINDFLNKHCRNFSGSNYPEIKLPPRLNWDNNLEFWNRKDDVLVVDKKSTNIIGKVEKSLIIELSKNVFLPIKKKDKEEWEKIVPIADDLNKMQKQLLQKFIFTISGEKETPLTKEEIITAIEEIRKPQKPQKYRQSGHLVDQKLKYSKSNTSLTVIESEETKKKIKESKLEIKVEGIRLSASENKLDHTLSRILYEKSQHRNPDAEDFYSGNDVPKLVPYGHEERKSPVVKFKRAELYKAYLERDDYSGAEAEFIDNLLVQFASKKFLIKYDRVKKIENESNEPETLTDRIETFTALIKLLHFYPDLTDEQKKKLDAGDPTIRQEKEEIIIAYSPIYIDQIDTKFIEFPKDTNRRLIIAAGGWNKVTSSMHKLMDWCMREKSAARFKSEINEETLVKTLDLEKYIKQNRKKRLQERIKKDIEAIKNMGIILKAEKKPNTTGSMKWVFHINEDYE